MKFLLDTNVVSALRVRGRNRLVELWAASVPVGDQFVSAFTIAEIERGVIAKERSDTEQGTVLRRWFDENVLPTFADRVLPFDLSAPRILAAYRVPEHAPLDDALNAAVAESADMTIATRNTRARAQGDRLPGRLAPRDDWALAGAVGCCPMSESAASRVGSPESGAPRAYIDRHHRAHMDNDQLEISFCTVRQLIPLWCAIGVLRRNAPRQPMRE